MAPIIAALLPAVLGTIVRFAGTAGGVAAAVEAGPQDDLQVAVGALVAAVCGLWGVLQKVKPAKQKARAEQGRMK